MNKQMIFGVVAFLVILAGMFFYVSMKQAEAPSAIINEPDPVSQEPVSDRFSYIQRVDMKHFFADGTHTLVGELNMPTPCDLLEASAVVAESFPEQIMVDFSVVSNAKACIQVITPARFSIEVSASEAATVAARLEGRPIEVNLIPAGEEESPDDFELYIKG